MSNELEIRNMTHWNVDNWAAFGATLWKLRGDIEADPTYLSVLIDMLSGLAQAVPNASLPMRVYIAVLADNLAELACNRIRGMADDCRWRAGPIYNGEAVSTRSDSNSDGSNDLPLGWGDDTEDDSDDLPY